MDQQNCIKMMRQWLDMSLAEIEEKTGLNFRTVKKYADKDPQQPATRERSRPVIGPYEETIDLWIEEDLKEPARQRRNATDIYEQLKEETDYDGSYSAVQRYVKEANKRIVQARNQQFARLEHVPGEAQGDFGDVWVYDETTGQRRLCKLLVLTFPHSNARFGKLLPAENQQCVLWGLSQLFEQMGGVPPKLWLDNLTPVVTEVKKHGNRKLTEAFQRFEMHYRFQGVFCNKNSPQEKGSVEKGVGTVRHWHLTPPPVVKNNDFEKINKQLEEGLREDRKKPHYEKEVSIQTLWKEDRDQLLKLPREPFEAVRIEERTVNKAGEVQIDNQRYHFPWCGEGQKVLVKMKWDRLEVLEKESQQFLGEVPREYVQRAEVVDWAAELKLLEHKPRALERATALKRLPQQLKEFLVQASVEERPRRVKTLITLFENDYTLDEIKKALQRGARMGRTSPEELQSWAEAQKLFDRDEDSAGPDVPGDWKFRLNDYDELLNQPGGPSSAGGDFAHE